MARDKKQRAEDLKKDGISRRKFVAGSGTVLAGGAIAVLGGPASAEKKPYARSTGYLVYDSRRCAGCQSCMLACSLVHEGETSTSLSRIQVSRAILTRYPYDIQISVCRQCPEPLCVENCPTGACHISSKNGNVRMIDPGKCVGCQTCLQSCPHTPHRTIWNPAAKKSLKCDLCVNAPYFSKQGGPAGKQACVTTCPMGALKLVPELPSQADISGYDIDLSPPSAPKSSPGAPAVSKPAESKAPAAPSR